MNLFHSTDTAWRGLVRDVLEQGDHVSGVQDPLSIGSNFEGKARDTRELLAAQMQILNPRCRIILSEVRPFRLDFAIAQVIWALSGSNELEPLTFYHHRGSEFSDDGHTVHSAIGKRIFRSEQGDQMAKAIDKIRNDHSTRRALIQIYLPGDLFVQSRDLSCTGSLHLLARGAKLHAIGQMRSQSTSVVLPYDLFLLTMLHEFATVSLGLELGTYWHICNSAHIYEDELSFTEALLKETPREVEPMPAMPASTSSELPILIKAEQLIRASLASNSRVPFDVRSLPLSPYWQDLLSTIISDWTLRHSDSYSQSRCDLLPPLYQRALAIGRLDSPSLTSNRQNALRPHFRPS